MRDKGRQGHHWAFTNPFRAFMSRVLCMHLARLAALLDSVLVRHARRIPGVVSGGAFYRGDLPALRVAMWAEPGAYVAHLGRLEIILDRP